MNEQKLSLRLASVADFIPAGAILADIGSDHAYLPAWLILNGKISQAIAGEVVKGPFESAQKLVRQTGLEQQIQVRLADGLAAIETTDQVDTLTICGMGGALIRTILNSGKDRLTGKERLILQPNNGEETLRRWLAEQQYQILAETILLEDGKIYEIIVAEKAAQPVTYTEREFFFGPHLLQERPEPAFTKKWQHEWENKSYVEAQLLRATAQPIEKLTEIRQQKKWIEEVLAR